MDARDITVEPGKPLAGRLLDRGAMTRAEALERARAVAVVAAPLTAETEALRRLPDPIVQAMIASELGMLLVPERWGGLGLDWTTAVDCIVEVGKVCGSTAWCLAFLIDHNWVLSLYPAEVQEAVYARDPQPRIFTASAPEGTVARAPGGYRLNGEWTFASGSPHCDWGLIGALLMGEGEPKFLNMLVGPGDFQLVEDSWRHFGLKGTGSGNVVLRDVFVPEINVVPWHVLGSGRGPGQAVNPEPLYRLPLGVAYPLGIMGPMLGVAKGALEGFVAFNANKMGKWSPERVADGQAFQAKTGEAAAAINAAEVLIRRNCQRLADLEEWPAEERAAQQRDYLFAAQLLTQGMDILMNAGGARGGREDNPLQRHFRDLHAMRQHALFNFDVGYANAGRLLLGLGPDPRALM